MYLIIVTDRWLFVSQVLNKEEQELAAKNEYNFDHPDAFDFELLITVLRKLKKGKSIKVPVYDFTNHSRRKEWVRKGFYLGFLFCFLRKKKGFEGFLLSNENLMSSLSLLLQLK